MLRPIMFHCVGFWISTGLPCIYSIISIVRGERDQILPQITENSDYTVYHNGKVFSLALAFVVRGREGERVYKNTQERIKKKAEGTTAKPERHVCTQNYVANTETNLCTHQLGRNWTSNNRESKYRDSIVHGGLQWTTYAQFRTVLNQICIWPSATYVLRISRMIWMNVKVKVFLTTGHWGPGGE